MSLTPEFQGVSAEHPWPGLMPFTEDAKAFFHGRDAEAAELLRLIKREPLTVLFGQSGLGKSSLLNAGLFPRLRQEDFLPVYIRLEISHAAPAPAAQTKAIIAANLERLGVDARLPRDDETLWEYFHASDVDFWNARNQLLTPVLVFDQFEEIFTLGRHNEQLRNRCRTFVEELGDLVEGRTPDSVVRRLEENPDLAARLDFGKRNCKTLLSFREDFLPDFEGLRRQIRSIMQNRMRLTRMNGSQALEAIMASGGHLVAPGVAERIIGFVAGPRATGEEGAGADYAHYEIEPALLSLVCRELNNKRISARRAQITADLLEAGAQQEIITDFYQRSLADLDPEVRVFVEDQLLTETGYRDSYALEDALRLPGVTQEAIDKLIARRLLRLDERFGVLRVELTHDVLTRVVRDSRDRRQASEADARRRVQEAERRSRSRRVAAIGAFASISAIAVAIVFAVLLQRSIEEKQRLVETQSYVLLAQANGLLDMNVAGQPQAILARSLDLNPANNGAIGRAVSYISQRSFPRSIAQLRISMDADDRFTSIGWRDASTVAFGSSKGISLVPLRPDAELRDFKVGGASVAEKSAVEPGYKEIKRTRIVRGSEAQSAWAEKELPITLTADGRVIAWIENKQRLRVAHKDSRRDYSVEVPDGARDPVVLSRDGQRLMFRSMTGDVHVYTLAENAAPVPLRKFRATDGSVLYGAEGRRLVALSKENVTTYDLESDRMVVIEHTLPVNALEMSRDGKLLVTACQDKFARIWNPESGTLAVEAMRHDSAVLSAAFSDDGQRVITGSLDGTSRIWSSASGELLSEPVVTGQPVHEARISPDGDKALTYSLDGRLGIWQIGSLMTHSMSTKLPSNIAVMEALAGRSHVAFASVDGEVSLWQISDDDRLGVRLARLWSRQAPDTVSQLRFSPDGNYLALAAGARVHLWHTASGKAAGAPLRHRGQVLAMRFNSNGALLATGSADGAARIWRVENQRLQGFPMLHGREPVSRLAFNRDSSLLLTGTSGARGGFLRIWDLHERTMAAKFASGDHISLADFSSDGEIVAVFDATAVKLNFRTNVNAGGWIGGGRERGNELPTYTITERATLEFGGLIWSAALSPDGAKLAVGGLDGTSRIVEVSTFRPLGEAIKSTGVVQAVEFSSDGRWIITRSADHIARVWDSRSGYAVTDIVRHDAELAGAALSGRGAIFLSASRNGTVALSMVGLDFPDPVPGWLPELVQVAGGGRFDQAGTMLWMADRAERLRTLGSRIASDDESWWRRWASGAMPRLASVSGVARKENRK